MSSFSATDLAAAARVIADHAESVTAMLNGADAALGDGDLGITVSRGWREVADNSDTFPDDVGMAFMACATSFQRVSPSSFGTLVATAFMTCAKACKGSVSVSCDRVADLLESSVQAMMARGKGQLGDKSVLDMIQRMAVAAQGLDEPTELLAAMHETARVTLDEFRDKPARLGRARMFGEKSIGLDDPGMLAVYEMVKALAQPAPDVEDDEALVPPR
jgi:dihydroxyacetone kinase-like protein